MEKNTLSIIIVLAILIGGVYYFLGNSKDKNSIEQKTKITASVVQVTKFYNGEEGYSLSIPEGNTSTCVWTWVGGSGAIPDSKTTTVATNATEKHVAMFGDYIDSLWDFKVSCTNDFGDQYTGVFPSQKN